MTSGLGKLVRGSRVGIDFREFFPGVGRFLDNAKVVHPMD